MPPQGWPVLLTRLALFTIAGAHLSSTRHSAEEQASSTEPVDVCTECSVTLPNAMVDSVGHSAAGENKQLSLAGKCTAPQEPAYPSVKFLAHALFHPGS